MNSHIDAQCVHMMLLVKNFENTCDLAALKDDGKVSKDEEKMLRQIHKAAQKFNSSLRKITANFACNEVTVR